MLFRSSTTGTTVHLCLRERSLPPLFSCSVALLALQPRYVHYDNRFLIFEVLQIFRERAFHAALYQSSLCWRMRVRKGLMNPALQGSPLRCVQGSGIVRHFAIAKVSDEDCNIVNAYPPPSDDVVHWHKRRVKVPMELRAWVGRCVFSGLTCQYGSLHV